MQYRSETFEKVEEEDHDLSELAQNIRFLWQQKFVQTAIKLRHKRFTVPDGIEYFYDELDAVFAAGYVPTIEDILRLRIRTTGMIEQRFTILSENHLEEYQLSLYDTGGERNERKKWISVFDGVDAVIFVAALSHFASVLWEDEKTLSLHDAIELFAEICNGKWFKRSEMILFLNKDDLFRQMLRAGISLNICFADVRREDYRIDNPQEITPPPSPVNPLRPDMADQDGLDVGVHGSDFPDFVDGLGPSPDLQHDEQAHCESIANQTASFVDPSNEDTNDVHHTEGGREGEGAPYEHLNEWLGSKWTGPNFKYDSRKTVEENNAYFEKCYDCAIEFIVSLFLKQNKDPNKTVYVHITTAIDEKNIADTFDEIRPLIINSNYAGHSKHFF